VKTLGHTGRETSVQLALLKKIDCLFVYVGLLGDTLGTGRHENPDIGYLKTKHG
jgi:hypothetical protein